MLTNLLKVYSRVYKTNGILILSRFFSFTHISRKKIAVFVLEELVFDSIFLCFFPFYSIFCSSSLSPFFDMIFSGIRCFFLSSYPLQEFIHAVFQAVSLSIAFLSRFLLSLSTSVPLFITALFYSSVMVLLVFFALCVNTI